MPQSAATLTETVFPKTASATKPRLLIVGPMVGANGRAVTTQSLILSKLFRSSGYAVVSTSTVANRYLRFADIVQTVVRKARQADVLILDVFGGPSFVVEDTVSRAAAMLGTPIVMFLRGGAMPDFMAAHPRWARRVLGRAAALVAPSDFLASALRAHGFDSVVVPNVLDLSKYPFRHRPEVKPRLFWMRTFHEIYNPTMAVRVLARVRKRYSEATLVMGGEEKGLLKATQELADDLGVAPALDFAGFLDLSGKVQHASRTDIFLNTNIVDNTPVSVLEAGALGLPVVATDVGGIANLLTNGHSGLLVKSNDDEAMADAVCNLVETPQLASMLSMNGRKLAESCDWNGVHARWQTLFELIRNEAN